MHVADKVCMDRLAMKKKKVFRVEYGLITPMCVETFFTTINVAMLPTVWFLL